MYPIAPVAFQVRQPAAGAAGSNKPSDGLFLLLAMALGFALVLASMLPGQALRPALVYEVVAVHRFDLALIGGSIVVVVGALYVLAS